MTPEERTSIHNLTSKLMQGTALEPSSAFHAKVMERVLSEQAPAPRSRVREFSMTGAVIVVAVLYLLGVAGLCVWMGWLDDGWLQINLKETFPLLLTVAGGLAFAFFFSLLDRRLSYTGMPTP